MRRPAPIFFVLMLAACGGAAPYGRAVPTDPALDRTSQCAGAVAALFPASPPIFDPEVELLDFGDYAVFQAYARGPAGARGTGRWYLNCRVQGGRAIIYRAETEASARLERRRPLPSAAGGGARRAAPPRTAAARSTETPTRACYLKPVGTGIEIWTEVVCFDVAR